MDSTPTSIKALVVQFPVTLDIEQNLAIMLSVLVHAEPDTLIVFPEGALSGYEEAPAFLDNMDRELLLTSLRRLREVVAGSRVHVVFGSCLWETGEWYNAGVYFGSHQETFIYRKVNLATKERGAFSAGTHLPVATINVGGRPVKFGIQLCREIRFPEQWQYLARRGADIFAYLTNATGDATQAPIWKSHLISRAAENQRFVLCANNAHPAQKCPSMIVSPSGSVLWETLSPKLETGRVILELSEVSGWYLSQSRLDLVSRPS